MTAARPDPQFARARAALAGGDLASAATLAQEILRRRRNDHMAMMIMADVAGRRGNLSAQIEWSRKAVRAEPRRADLRVYLGHRLLRGGLVREAVDEFEKALRLEPGLVDAVAGLATGLEVLGRDDAVARVLAPFLKREPPPAEVGSAQMRLLLRRGEIDEAIALGERVRAGAIAPSMLLRSTLCSLAAAYERAGRYDEAFDAARASAAVLAPAWRPDAFDEAIDAMIALATPDLLRAMPKPAEPSDVPVFIVGLPRCGSTLLERMLHAHPDAGGVGELGTLDVICGPIARRIGTGKPYPQCLADLTAEHAEALQRDYLALLRERAGDRRRIVNKELFNLQHLALVAGVLPRASIIHCRRDPRDLRLSCFMSNLPVDSCPWASDVEHIRRFQAASERLSAHWRRTLPEIGVRYIEIDYETVVAEPETAARRVLEACDLPWHDAVLRPHEVQRTELTLSRDQVTRPLYDSSVGRWRHYAAHLGEPLDAPA